MEVPTTEILPKDQFLNSLERCASNEGFIPAFYERFMDSSDVIREKFEETSFETQNRMLLRSLRLAAAVTQGDPKSLAELRDRAESHDRHHLNIQPALYNLWLAALLETAAEFDECWNESIKQAWQSILGFVIHRMQAKY